MTKYFLDKNLIIQKVEGNLLIFSPTSSELFTLNETAGIIIESIISKLDESQIEAELLKNYQVNNKMLKKDLKETISLLLEKKIIKKMSA